MNEGKATGRFVRTGMPITVCWQEGLITSVAPAEEPAETESIWIAPALVDLQINGYAGVDFQKDTLCEEELMTAVRALRRDGCTRVLFTLITDDWEKMMSRLEQARKHACENAELRKGFVGWHIEGPFLSSEPGFCGAHDPSKMIDPRRGHLDQIRSVTGGDPVLLTIAPERNGAINAIEYAVELGFRISLGHTNASSRELRRAVGAGATGFTHLGNGCPQSLDRHDNIIWRALDIPDLAVSLINDGHHVSAELFRLLHRTLRPDQICHTTDAMSAAGAAVGTVAPRGPLTKSTEIEVPTSSPNGAHGVTRPTVSTQTFTLGSMKLEVGQDGVVRQPGKTNFAGSSLTPIDGVFRAAKLTGKPWQEMWLNSSLRPAEFMGWTSDLKVGQPADFCLIEVDGHGEFVSVDVCSH